MARKRFRQDPGALAETGGFDMTPMIDVTFLLIIFFMCVTELADASKAELILPQAEKAEKILPVPGRMTINVLRDGDVEVMGEIYDDAALSRMLDLERQISSSSGDEFPDRAVLIRADRQAEYSAVQHVMAMCMEHKLWRIAFATKNEVN